MDKDTQKLLVIVGGVVVLGGVYLYMSKSAQAAPSGGALPSGGDQPSSALPPAPTGVREPLTIQPSDFGRMVQLSSPLEASNALTGTPETFMPGDQIILGSFSSVVVNKKVLSMTLAFTKLDPVTLIPTGGYVTDAPVYGDFVNVQQ